MIGDGFYVCDYCGESNTGQFYTETGNHVECQDHVSLQNELQEIQNLLNKSLDGYSHSGSGHWIESARNRVTLLIEKMKAG